MTSQKIHCTNSFWPNQISVARAFLQISSGAEYNYRNKALMGLAKTHILSEREETTPKEDVVFNIPENVTRLSTDKEIMIS